MWYKTTNKTQNETRNVSEGHGYPQLKKLKCKLLTPDMDGDGPTDRGNTIMPFPPFFDWLGHKKLL